MKKYVGCSMYSTENNKKLKNANFKWLKYVDAHDSTIVLFYIFNYHLIFEKLLWFYVPKSWKFLLHSLYKF